MWQLKFQKEQKGRISKKKLDLEIVRSCYE